LIFVDIDGVLNVGIHDGDQAPLLLNQDNRMYAMNGNHFRCNAAEKQCVQKVLAVMERQLERDSGETFGSLTCGQNKQWSDILVGRLAQIIASAGERRKVVLASNWRKPKYATRVRRLEMEISRHLGKSFAFDARTRPAEERCAADRLRCIGDYVQSHFQSSNAAAAAPREGPLRVLVLDDFFITPLDGWSCDGAEVRSSCDAEVYLQSRVPAAAEVAVRVLHPYAEWESPSRGLSWVQVGAGLSARHCSEAASFLGGGAAAGAAGASGGEPVPPPLSSCQGEKEEQEAAAAAAGQAAASQSEPKPEVGKVGSEEHSRSTPELVYKSNTLADAVDSTMMASLVGVCFSGCMTAVPWLFLHL